MEKYLQHSTYINWRHPSIVEKACILAEGKNTDTDIAKACFEFVRDEIKHSWDYQLNPVTCVASDVLEHGTGYCYAKSHLLASLLRANKIPTGLCYQRLTISNNQPPFSLHGLNAVYLKDYGWYRIDPRGNKEGVDSQFTPPNEKLAFSILTEGEADLPEIWSQPHPEVVRILEKYSTIQEVAEDLPDIMLATG
ncbi:MAG: transglutaminase family protein [Cellvibrionaceae bacterium]